MQQKWPHLVSSRLLSKNLKIKIYRTVILPVVLYGCETWSLTLREERKLRVFENMVLRRIFRPRRDEVTGEWRWLHNEELNDMYSWTNIVRVIKSRRMRWAGHVARMGEERGCIGSWWGNRRETWKCARQETVLRLAVLNLCKLHQPLIIAKMLHAVFNRILYKTLNLFAIIYLFSFYPLTIPAPLRSQVPHQLRNNL